MLDRYRALSLLGEGMQGAVWRALDEKTGDEVALKLHRDRSAAQRESDVMRRVRSRRVVRFIASEGTAVIRELPDGPTLRDTIRAGGQPDWRVLVDELTQAQEDIIAAGCTPSDVTEPSNVVVSARGAVVIDVGGCGIGVCPSMRPWDRSWETSEPPLLRLLLVVLGWEPPAELIKDGVRLISLAREAHQRGAYAEARAASRGHRSLVHRARNEWLEQTHPDAFAFLRERGVECPQ